MNEQIFEWLVTPYGVLGGDSFTVRATDYDRACQQARARIRAEHWRSNQGWEVFQKRGTFHE